MHVLGSMCMVGCAADAEGAPWIAPRESALDVAAPDLLPTRVRRLSNAEYERSVAALLGAASAASQRFAPDKRQSGFTNNDAQRVDAVLAQQLYAAAAELAEGARAQLAQLAPCDAGQSEETCAQSFIARVGARAFRRPLSDEESAGLLNLYREGALDATYAEGIELVLRALLQSASFLYVTELGDAAPDEPGITQLGAYELASELSYLITGGPPDAPLLEAAASGALSDPEERRSQLLRLRAEHPESRDQLVRILREWLELDRTEITAKDVAFYPTYDQYGPLLARESRDFIAAVLDDDGEESDLHSLLSADWTIADPMLTGFYGGEERPDGRLHLPQRRGILNQGAFLAVHAHAYESSPILRGAAIARRIACISVPDPTSLGIQIMAPPSDPALTTRQRFSAHTADPSCAQCHVAIDGFGDAFERYDGMGAEREMDNAVPVDSSTMLQLGADFDGAYADSNALALALASSVRVQECFARNLFRAASARSPELSGAAAAEDAFIAEWGALPEAARGNVLDTLALLVGSRVFSERRVAP